MLALTILVSWKARAFALGSSHTSTKNLGQHVED